MHVLVTGASGFIGQRLVQILSEHGHRVSPMSKSGGGGEGGFVQCDLGKDTVVLPAGVDAVVHLAQSRSYRAFPGDAAEMFRVNVAGAQHLLEAAAAHGVQRFCLVSTGSVYEPFDTLLLEDSALAPTSYLGASKLAAEIIARPFAKLMKLPVLRLFAPYGPGQTDKLLPELIRRVRVGEAVTLPESGGGMVFAPTYVDDICNVILASLTEGWEGAVNVAAPEAVSVAEAVSAIAAELGRDAVIERKAMAAPRVVPELGKLASRYDLGRFRSFKDGLCLTVAKLPDLPSR